MNRMLRQVLTMVLVFVFIISSVVPAYAESTEETTTSPSMVTVTFKMNRGDDTTYQEVQVPAGSSLGDHILKTLLLYHGVQKNLVGIERRTLIKQRL